MVELIEGGKLKSHEMTILLSSFLKPMMDSNIDSLVLGCTHYPYLIPQIRKIVGSKIRIIDSGEAVAKQTKAILSKNELLNTTENYLAKHSININSDKSVLENLLSNIKNENIKITERNF